MKKSEVEQILIVVKSREQESLTLKFYKNGIINRRGCCARPEINTSGLSVNENSNLFDQMLSNVPDDMIENPIIYQEENITMPVEFVVAFFGDSTNGETGSGAQWSKSTGIRYLLNETTNIDDPNVDFLNDMRAFGCKLTDAWYFDVIMFATQGLKSDKLPEETIITASKNKNEVLQDFYNYIAQSDTSKFQSYAEGKIYTDEKGLENKLKFEITSNSVDYKLEPVGIKGIQFASMAIAPKAKKVVENNVTAKNKYNEPISEKKWWQFWK